jgi:hypothetical protein
VTPTWEKIDKTPDADMCFYIPPSAQGQIVERAYSVDWVTDTLWRRCTDQSIGEGQPGRVTYSTREIDEHELTLIDVLNHEPA